MAPHRGPVATVDEVMEQPAVGVGPGAPLKEVAVLLAERRVAGVPVVDDERRVLGIVVQDRILRRGYGAPNPAIRRPFGRRRNKSESRGRFAADVMTTPAPTVPPSMPLSQAAMLVMTEGMDILAVVDTSDGTLVGTVGRGDLMRFLARSDRDVAADVERHVRRYWIPFRGLTVRAVCGEVLLRGSVESEADAQMAANAARRVPGVFVVESQLRPRRADSGSGPP